MAHTHIGKDDWVVIARMLRAGFSVSAIARTIGKTVGALSRHITHHGGRNGYTVREVRRKKRMTRILAMDGIRVLKGALLRTVVRALKQYQSPEQIVGMLRRSGTHIAASTIYRHIKDRAPHLKKYLRSQKGRYRRRHRTKIREAIRERAKKRRINERPPVVERRSRIGDFEGDTMMGRDKRVRIVTFVDRKSGYLIADLLPFMRAELLTSRMLTRLKRLPKEKRKTLTLDNGPEFSDWERFEEKSGMTVYFAYPYHSWERGTNENTNGLLRQYFPKSYDFNLITPEELARVVRLINDRPRKRHKFKNPCDVFWKK